MVGQLRLPMYCQYWINIEEMAYIRRIDRQLLNWLSGQEQREIAAVHSIFDKVVNLLTKDENRLISFALEAVVQAPDMMKTNEAQVFTMFRDSIQVGEIAQLESDSTIRIGTTFWSYEGAVLWDGTIPRIRSIHLENLAGQIATFLHRHAEKRDSGLLSAWLAYSGHAQQAGDADLVYTKVFLEGLCCFDEAIRSGQTQDMLHASGRLLGLGLGLTPSGDDFLLGCLALWQVFDMRLFSPYKECDWLKQIKGKTTTHSYFMLKQCIDGFVNNAFIELFQVIGKGGDMGKALDEFLRIGSTSGIDMLIGALFAMQYTKKG